MRIWVLGLVAILGSCSSSEQREADRAKAVIAGKLKDPESAKFTDVKVLFGTVCGMVNGRNSFGAYSGAERFAGNGSSTRLRSEAENADSLLSGTPAGESYRPTEWFDKSWDRCQQKGIAVK
ncbi:MULTISPECIES: hypothetical protein [unclassified Novosphingobium]|uniref:hypothetical protein n=1 Tax=unclassified Novosphingobium TaxID=2644732 RepID=UPI00135A2F30|nr:MULTISPECIES: hypothetical protein [unclassified Novosphingobium]